MTEAEATIRGSILMGLADHGGKIMRAESGKEMTDSILQYLFNSNVTWSVEQYLKEIRNEGTT